MSSDRNTEFLPVCLNKQMQKISNFRNYLKFVFQRITPTIKRLSLNTEQYGSLQLSYNTTIHIHRGETRPSISTPTVEEPDCPLQRAEDIKYT